MAKLTGVQTIDMVNGEITKVSYNGEEYAKVETGDVGDIAVIVDGWGSQSDGEFYVVTDITSSCGNTYAHIVGEHRGANGNVERMKYFRKISAQASPTIADINAKLDEIDTRLTTLEKADEPLKVGDYAIVVGGDLERLSLNDVVLIRGKGNKYDFRVFRLSDDKNELFYANDLRKATDEEVAEAKAFVEQPAKDSKLAQKFTQVGRKPNEYRKGDIVRVTRGGFANINEGDIGIVLEDDVSDLPKISVGGYEHHNYVELIATVESRLDRN